MTEREADATRLAARIVGPLLVIMGAVVIARAGDMVLLIPAILQDGPLVFITGVFTLICGVTLFALHHHWSSAASIAITLLAILTAVRGIVLLFAPSLVAGVAHQLLVGGPGAWIAGLAAMLIGAWLSFVGWFTLRGQHA